MRRARVIVLAVSALTATAMPGAASPRPASAASATAAMVSAADTRMAMRKLWEDHITWTRVYIIAALAGLPDKNEAAARLLKNQEDIGAAIVPFYGQAAGRKLTALLKEHIGIATEVVAAAKAGNASEVAAQQRRWSANADDIAAFLSSANPNWRRTALRAMLQRHLDLTSEEVVSRLRGDWAADIRAYDTNHTHMLMFSDALVDGIRRQFPRRFRA